MTHTIQVTEGENRIVKLLRDQASLKTALDSMFQTLKFKNNIIRLSFID